MIRIASIAAVAALAASPALAMDCNWGNKSSAATYGAPATTAFVQPVASQPLYSQPVTAQPASASSFVEYAPTQPAVTYVTASPDIVDTAISAGSFGTLVAAVQAAGLVDTLKGPGPFTVFAPTDAAFAALPAGTVENLLKPENRDQLTAILTYHVVPGKVTSTDLAGKMTSASTVQGTTIDIDATSGVTVEGANVVTADIETSNGVIHVIDSVLIPGT